MYRVLVLCAILTLAEPTWHRRHRHCPSFRHHGRHCSEVAENLTPVSRIQTIGSALVEQYEKFQKLCTDLHNTPREMYGTDSYHLFYNLPSNDPKTKVQIKYKFIHTTVTSPSGNETLFEDVRIVPDMVKTEDAVYTIQNKDVLKITIPYKVPLGTEADKDCGVINKNVLDVPEVKYPEFRYRGGKVAENVVY